MKKLLSLLLSLLIIISAVSVSVSINAAAENKKIGNTGLTYYVDADNGNDKKDGLTPETAWQTLENVNKTTFSPGSAILFKRGCIWTDTFLWPKGTGDKDNINYISCYGDETKDLPYIASLYDDQLDGLPNYDTCLFLGTNQNYWDISNLSLYNGTNGTGTQYVVKFYSDNNSNRMIGNYLHDCIINGSNPNNWSINSRSGLSGINIEGWIDGITIENNQVSNVKTNGIGVNGWNAGCNYKGEINKNAAKGVVIRGNTLYNIGKDGILPNNCNQPLVEYNVCGKAHSYATNTAHVAMWPFASYGSLFQYNEAYDTRTIYDGQGFDCDYQCYYTTFQYNYSHDNVGGFMLICTEAKNWDGGYSFNKGSTVRYNISQADKHYTFNFTDAIEDTRIYNNTIYASRNTGGNATHLFFSYDKGVNSLSGRSLPHNTLIANNIFWLDKMPGVGLGNNTETVFKNNLFAGKNFKNCPDNGTVTTKTDSSGNEVYLYREVSGNIEGADPLFIDGGRASIGRESCDVYKLYEGSPAIGTGYYIEDGFHECPTDFFGNPIDKDNINMGAYQGKGEARPQYIFDEKYHTMIDFESNDVGAKGTGTEWSTMSGIDRLTSSTNTSTAFVDITDDYNALNQKTKSTKALRLVNTGTTAVDVSAKFYLHTQDLKNANGFRIYFNPNGEQQAFTVYFETTADGKSVTYSKSVTVKNPEYRIFTFNEKYNNSNNLRVTPENMRKSTTITIKAKLQTDREVFVDDIQVNNGEMDEIESSEKFYNEKADVTLVEDFETTTVGSNTNYANCWSGPKGSPAGGSAVCPNGTKAIYLTNSSNTNTAYSGGYAWKTGFDKLKSALANDTLAEGIQFELITDATVNGVAITEEQKYMASDNYNRYKLSFAGASLSYTTVGGVTKTVSTFGNGDKKLQTDPNNLCRIPFSDLYTTYTEDGVTYKVYLTDFSEEDQQKWKTKISNIGLSCSTYGTTIGKLGVFQYIYLDNLSIYKNVQHDVGDWVTISNPTCTRDGVKTKTCSVCNRIMDSETVTATGHKEGEWVETKAPECEVAGEKTISCTVCEKIVKTESIPKLNHSYSNKTVKPTCEEDGYDCEECSNCGEQINKTNIVEALGHKNSEWIVDVPATCTDDGSMYKKCKDCSLIVATSIQAFGHTMSETVVEPTCDEGGYTLHKCKNCDYTYADQETGKLTHEYKLISAVFSTCEVEGAMIYACSMCGDTYQDAVEKLNHEYKIIATFPATCINDGANIFGCKCGDTYEETIEKLTHSEKVIVKKQPTYFEEGEQRTVCEKCNAILSEETLEKLTLKVPEIKLSKVKAKGKFKVKYTKVQDAKGFELRFRIKGKWTIKQFKATKNITRTIKNLKKGKYKVQARAYVKNGKEFAYSKWSKTQKIQVK